MPQAKAPENVPFSEARPLKGKAEAGAEERPLALPMPRQAQAVLLRFAMSEKYNSGPETGAFFARDRAWHAPAFTPGYKTSVLRSPKRALLSLDGTLSEITGPVFGHGTLGDLDNDLIHNFARAGESAIGERIIVHGQVLDERARPQAGVLVEFWQANAGGRYRHKKETYLAAIDPNFGGCGRRSPTRTVATRSAPSGPAPIPGRTGSMTGARLTSIFQCSATALPSGSSPRCISRVIR